MAPLISDAISKNLRIPEGFINFTLGFIKSIKNFLKTEIINPYIYQDIVHTTNVVMHIVRNAIKYTPSGGKIKIGIRQTKGKTNDTCFVEFICEDTGIGISPEFLPYMCQSFCREDNEINNEIQSSGIGLNISKALLELMDGTLEIKSELNKGTTVITKQPHRYAKKSDIENASTLVDNVRS